MNRNIFSCAMRAAAGAVCAHCVVSTGGPWRVSRHVQLMTQPCESDGKVCRPLAASPGGLEVGESLMDGMVLWSESRHIHAFRTQRAARETT